MKNKSSNLKKNMDMEKNGKEKCGIFDKRGETN